jgi:Tol biopolymer transport system component
MAAAASSAAAGVVAFSPLVDASSQIHWFSIEGVQGDTLALPNGQYTDVRLSPDGARAATSSFDPFNALKSGSDIWLADLSRKGGSRITFDSQFEFAPVWSPDGRSIYYNGNKTGGYLIYRLSVDGAGQPVAVTKSKGLSQQPDDVSPDGRTILFESQESSTGYDLWLQDASGQAPPTSYLSTPFNEQDARISPDGRWVAYVSDESGKSEVYVQSFPVPGSKIQVSNGGARQPHWRRDGERLFFLAPDFSLMSCDVTPGALRVEQPVKLFRFPRLVYSFDIAPDGKRLLASMAKTDAEGRSIGVVLDF